MYNLLNTIDEYKSVDQHTKEPFDKSLLYLCYIYFTLILNEGFTIQWELQKPINVTTKVILFFGRRM